MRSSQTRLGRLGAGIITGVVVASFAMVAPASADTNGIVTVSGESKSKIVLTLSDSTAQFGTNLTPDGDASNAAAPDVVVANVDPSETSLGACYEWPGYVRVKSNVVYNVKVSAAASNTHLDFLTADPGSYAACTGGEAVAEAMFTGATPAGAWDTDLAKTAKHDSDYWLGLQVLWTDDPSDTLGNASLTLTAVADV
jgi:hypothetical protein